MTDPTDFIAGAPSFTFDPLRCNHLGKTLAECPHCQRHLRQLDIFLAEKLFGWKVTQEFSGTRVTLPDGSCHYRLEEYSTSPAAMIDVIEKMKERGFLVKIDNGSSDWHVEFYSESPTSWDYSADSIPLAVARAAIAALEGK